MRTRLRSEAASLELIREQYLGDLLTTADLEAAVEHVMCGGDWMLCGRPFESGLRTLEDERWKRRFLHPYPPIGVAS